ncbi:MAG: hypothetical protein Ta2B_29540 [Termitinemataceae bacterium]|nr:MAG: hypothetical protein Ta2B_29540 [Termitinemataceae bacterium]
MGKSKRILFIFFIIVWIQNIFPPILLSDDDDTVWYVSNAAGMPMEKAFPLRALRSKNGLAVKNISEASLPSELRKYYLAPWKITQSILYEDGQRVKTQWVFRDEISVTLFVASISNDGSGFIEWYNDKGLIVEEQRLDEDGGGFFISYTYKDNTLLKAEAHLVSPIEKPPEIVPEEDAGKKDLDTKTSVQTKDESIADTNLENEIVTITDIVRTVNDDIDTDLDIEGGSVEEIDDIIARQLAQGAADFAKEQNIKLPVSASDKPSEAEKAIIDAAERTVPKIKVSQLAQNPQGPAAIPDFFVARTGRESGIIWTDSYRYTRTASLRLIERKFHPAKPDDAVQVKQTVKFPRTIPEQIRKEEETEGTSQPIDASFLEDVLLSIPAKIIYKTDSRKRVLTETRIDENGDIIGEVIYTWKGDKLAAVEWRATGDERRVDYTYNSRGERVSEKDYRNGVLERSVVMINGQEIESLYKEEKEILRAVWEEGRKISEKRFAVRNKNLDYDDR